MSLSRTVSEINGDFSRKSQIFPPRVFCAIAEGVPLGIWYRPWGQNTNDGATALRKKFDDIFSRLDTCTNVTDGHRTTANTALTHSVAR